MSAREPVVAILAVCSLTWAGCSGETVYEPSFPMESMVEDGGAPNLEPDEQLPVFLDCPKSTQGFATEVVSHTFGEGQDFGQDAFPDAVLGGPQGGGCCAGSLQVTSLGDGGSVVLGFGERRITDEDGPDFIVFENSFLIGGDSEAPLAEPGLVSVSVDGEVWLDFPCSPSQEDGYLGCSGAEAVYANVLDSEAPSPFDPEVSGGSAYDLADLGLDEARYVRVTDIAGDDVVFDLDAVAVVHGKCD